MLPNINSGSYEYKNLIISRREVASINITSFCDCPRSFSRGNIFIKATSLLREQKQAVQAKKSYERKEEDKQIKWNRKVIQK